MNGVKVMVRNRDIKGAETDINRLERDIAFGKVEIGRQLGRMDTASLNIDHLESELADEKNDFEDAKKMVVDCRNQIEEDGIILKELKAKLLVMNGEGEVEYVRPCEKTRPGSETTLVMHGCYL